MSLADVGHALLALAAIVAPLWLVWLLLAWRGRRKPRPPADNDPPP